MDLALGNLIELKRRILPATMLTQTTYDAAITAIGRGVAGLFDKHCNRKLGRLSGAQDQFSADRLSYTLERYPVESITTIEQRDTLDGGWETLAADTIINQDLTAGLLHFGTSLGSYLSQVRITYVGGYWYDTAETEDTTLPTGATRVPYDVKEAWFLQCQEVWDKRDKLGVSLVSAPDAQSKLSALELIPQVKQLLQGHIRFQMT
jgi:hypothetical protein